MTKTIDDDPDFGIYDGICQGCDALVKVNDIGMCEDCAAKLDRDLIRKRDWEYSAFAFGCPVDKREELREHIIARYGERLEILAAEPPPTRKSRRNENRRARMR